MTALAAKNISYWVASTSGTDYGGMQDDWDCDVCVIGGGIVGITTAFLLKSRGARVCLLEARELAKGVSGHTTAKVTALHGAVYHQLVDRHGKETAYLYARANEEALEWIARTTNEHGIQCDFHRSSAYTVALADEKVRILEREAEIASGLGLSARYVDGSELAAPMEAGGAVRLDDQAHFHPRKYLLALAAGIPGDGSAIFEHTRAVGIEENDSGDRGCRIRTSVADGGGADSVSACRSRAGGAEKTVRADRVVVATGLPFSRATTLYMRTMPLGHHMLALETEGDAPGGMFLSEDTHPRSIRPQAADGALTIVAGHGRRTGHGDSLEDAETLLSQVRERLSGSTVAYRWWTEDWYSFDQLPFVGKLERFSKVFTATGFGGWGMTNGTAASLLIADLVDGRKNDYASVYDPFRIHPSALDRRFLQHNLDSAGHFIGPRLNRRSADLGAVGVGEGQVLEVGGSQIAVSRDYEGTLRAVSASCPHLRCMVVWNEAQQTWDCPCHGARFLPDGSMLSGPAFQDLEVVELEEGGSAE